MQNKIPAVVAVGVGLILGFATVAAAQDVASGFRYDAAGNLIEVIDTTRDNNNCGVPDAVCQASTSCCGGSCRTAAFYASDVNNCGACENACSRPANGWAACVNGTCTTGECDAPYQTCNNQCVNTSTDANHCGGCGAVCPTLANGRAGCENGFCRTICNAGYTYCNGACRPNSDFMSDSNNCGSCGNVCPNVGGGLTWCESGGCVVECRPRYVWNGTTCVYDPWSDPI